MSGISTFAEPSASKIELEEGQVLSPRFDAAGLVTTVVTDWTSGELLMVAYMNAEAFDLTISSGIAHYYSRSRASLWKKGETSGALQSVREIRVDCDQDAIWLRVDVSAAEETCHTHRTTCFYRLVDRSGDGRSLLPDSSLPQHNNSASA